MILEGFEAGEGSTARYEFMTEAGFVLFEVRVLVDLLVGVLGVT